MSGCDQIVASLVCGFENTLVRISIASIKSVVLAINACSVRRYFLVFYIFQAVCCLH